MIFGKPYGSARITLVESEQPQADVMITEIGGTTGDIEGLPFLEAIRQFILERGPTNAIVMHVTLLPFIKAAGELKTKPSQQSVAKLREIGLQPQVLICRTEHALDDEIRAKLSTYCNVPLKAVVEMRDVEQRLGKPDPSEDTQAKQKQIIKRIDTLIEQVRQSGSSAGRLTIRFRRQQGNQPGQQGDQPGALAQGAGPMKAAKPTSQHSTAGGKGAWGHLPPELRQVMENTFKEEMLSSKQELISRYFLSVGEGKLKRDE